MNAFRRRLGERWCDVLDWVDYRRNANFWPFFALPPVLAATWAYVGPIGLGIVLGFALLATVLAAVATGLSVAAWVGAKTLLDVAAPALKALPDALRLSPARTRSV